MPAVEIPTSLTQLYLTRSASLNEQRQRIRFQILQGKNFQNDVSLYENVRVYLAQYISY